jgi:hypothetical protein
VWVQVPLRAPSKTQRSAPEIAFFFHLLYSKKSEFLSLLSFDTLYFYILATSKKHFMKNKIYTGIASLALTALLVACKSENKEANTLENESANTTQNTDATQTQNDGAEVKLNPPHGQPGHRCDIPVGQPLNSTPNQINVQSNSNNQQSPIFTTNQNQQVINTNTSSNSNQGSNLNPPHGQPGHRCDIPVGQPLPAE